MIHVTQRHFTIKINPFVLFAKKLCHFALKFKLEIDLVLDLEFCLIFFITFHFQNVIFSTFEQNLIVPLS